MPGGLKYFQTKYPHFSGQSLFIIALPSWALTSFFLSDVPETSVAAAKRRAQDRLAGSKPALIQLVTGDTDWECKGDEEILMNIVSGADHSGMCARGKKS